MQQAVKSLIGSIRHWCCFYLRRKPAKRGRAVDLNPPWEEERSPSFRSAQYYSVKIGERLVGRYVILGKLGYGANSTVWYCRDLKERTFKALKICTYDHGTPSREQYAYDHIKALGLDEYGPEACNIRQCVDSFTIMGRSGHSHRCFVFEAVACTVQNVWDNLSTGAFELSQIKLFARHALLGLDFLHRAAGIVHTDLKPDNIFIVFKDGNALSDFAKKLERRHQPVKTTKSGYRVHQSVGFDNFGRESWSHPVLGDLGEARIISTGRGESHDWQKPLRLGAPPLQAPETVLGCVWNYVVDIWMLGVVILWMLDNELPFTRDLADEDNLPNFVAQMHALLGSPPPGFLTVVGDQPFWDMDGAWVHQTSLPAMTWSHKLQRVPEPHRAETADFLLSMLKWLPTKRSTAAELLQHPWLQS